MVQELEIHFLLQWDLALILMVPIFMGPQLVWEYYLRHLSILLAWVQHLMDKDIQQTPDYQTVFYSNF